MNLHLYSYTPIYTNTHIHTHVQVLIDTHTHTQTLTHIISFTHKHTLTHIHKIRAHAVILNDDPSQIYFYAAYEVRLPVWKTEEGLEEGGAVDVERGRGKSNV